MITEEFMKEVGKMIDDMVKVLRNTVIAILMKVSSAEARQTAKVFTNGKMGKFMRANGLMGKKMAKESGEVILEFIIFIDTFGERYTGDWRDNKANGKGEHIWATGDRYEGDWMDFLKHGLGTDYFANGD